MVSGATGLSKKTCAPLFASSRVLSTIGVPVSIILNMRGAFLRIWGKSSVPCMSPNPTSIIAASYLLAVNFSVAALPLSAVSTE